MSTTTEIIEQVKELIKEGEQTHKAGAKDYQKHHKARRLLLEHAYEKAVNAELQQAYSALIPDNEIFKAEKVKSLDKLLDKDLQVRLQAIRYISKVARYVEQPDSEAWLAHPMTVTMLIEALHQETEIKVQQELIITIGAIYSAYFKDQRITTELLKQLEASNTDVLVAAINWTSFFDHQEKWDKILNILRTRKFQKILVAVCNHINLAKQIPLEIKLEFLTLLVDCRERKLNEDSRFQLLYTLISLVDETTLAHFHKLVNLKKDQELQEVLDDYIEINEHPEEHEQPEENLAFIKEAFAK